VGEFFLIVGLVILTAVIFVVWLVVHLTGVVFRAVFRGGSGKSVEGSSNETLPTGWKACRHGGCRATNLEHASFCRRCGGAIARGSGSGGGQPARMRYVA
jgi:hypothetical protein